jgi:hypothetical protein
MLTAAFPFPAQGRAETPGAIDQGLHLALGGGLQGQPPCPCSSWEDMVGEAQTLET